MEHSLFVTRHQSAATELYLWCCYKKARRVGGSSDGAFNNNEHDHYMQC